MISAQTADHLLAGQDSILVELGERNEIIYTHQVKAKQTIYRIARSFEQSPTLLLKYNGLRPDSIIAIDQNIKVVIPQVYIDKSVIKPDPHALAIVYKVKAKETLYGISKTYFDQPIESLILRNQIPDFNLSIDQNLIVGWISFQKEQVEIIKTQRETKPVTAPTVPRISSKLKRAERDIDMPEPINRDEAPEDESLEGIARIIIPEDENEMPTTEIDSIEENIIPEVERITVKGIAKWNKSGNDLRNLFVMHRKAKINSMIALRNPMNNRTVEARVVGHIQKNMVSNDVSIIISPAVAHQLGILDSRALVEIAYVE